MKLIVSQIIILIQLLVFIGCSNQGDPPGVVITSNPAFTERYIGSPSIAIVPSGKYVASHDFFGPKSQMKITRVFESGDKGLTWTKISELDGQWWSSLFMHNGYLYLMGTTKKNGYCVIRRSEDEGKTWTEPKDSLSGLLLSDSEYHTAPMPFLIHDGRIWRAMEERNPPEKWGVNFLSFVMSARIDTDLLKASSWRSTNRLRYNQEWEGKAWLEGNVVLTPEKKLVNILRCAKDTIGGRACIINISSDGKTASFDSSSGFIDFPGGSKKFSIRYDETTQKYWSLANPIPQKYEGHKPANTRNTLAIISSKDLKNWEVNKIILQHDDVKYVGFQYVDWLFEKDDLISVIRTGYPEKDGTNAHNAHDANHLLFLRIENFRNN